MPCPVSPIVAKESPVKKREQKPPREKPFSTSPFLDLKGIRVSEGEKQPLPPPQLPPVAKAEPDESLFLRQMAGVRRLAGDEAPAPVPAADDDLALFLREMSDVRRVGTPRPAKGVAQAGAREPHPLVRKLEEEESRLFLEAFNDIDVRFEEEPDDEAESLQPSAAGRMKRLKRGEIRIDLELDLHGLTREEALDSLAAFITSAWKRGQQAVLVITGKGLNSPGEPVLQGAVAAWLRESCKGMVAEFSPAPGRMGGSGAYVVFLKEKGTEA